jgi:hypothetical protein
VIVPSHNLVIVRRGKVPESSTPDVSVELIGQDANAFYIIGRVRQALGAACVSDEEISQFTAEATSGNYENVLRTCRIWVDVA